MGENVWGTPRVGRGEDCPNCMLAQLPFIHHSTDFQQSSTSFDHFTTSNSCHHCRLFLTDLAIKANAKRQTPGIVAVN